LTKFTQLLAKLMLNRLPTPETSRGESPPLWNSFFVEGGAPVAAMTDARRINKQGSRWLCVHYIITGYSCRTWKLTLLPELLILIYYLHQNLHKLSISTMKTKSEWN
jgi:hypothetical protein